MKVSRLAFLLLLVNTAVGASPQSATVELHALFSEAWERELKDNPVRASGLGDRRYDALWPDLSSAVWQRRHRADVETLGRLEHIERALLPPDEQLNYELFAYEYRRRVTAYPFKPWLYETRAADGIHTLSTVAEMLPFATVADYENWIARLRSVDRYIEQYTEELRTGVRERRVHSQATMRRVATSLRALTAASDVTSSPFYRPFLTIPESILPEIRARLQEQGQRAIAEVLQPAYRRFEKFFVDDYLPHCRTTVGIWDTPDGDAFYRERAAYFTTTSLSPEAIHAIGLKEVARIRQQIESLMHKTDFEGDFREFIAFLREDRRFYYDSADELFRAYVVTTKLIEPELVKLFRTLPRTPLGVRPVPANIAPNTPTAYYMAPAADGSRAGYYYVNLHQHDTRPKFEIEVLTAHEPVPGHHLQIALAKEQENVPAFRRDGRIIAFSEGWALYSESLGEQLGLYKDPYSKYGALSYDLWRAVRLVVDTGIHYKRWNRHQAIEYFKANSSKSEREIETEVDRYIDWPGQALAYKVGQLRFLELRTRARDALGSRFDIRDFHDVVLRNGPLPFDVLERIVNGWVEEQRQG